MSTRCSTGEFDVVADQRYTLFVDGTLSDFDRGSYSLIVVFTP